MPNHVTSWVEIHHEDKDTMAKFKKKVIKPAKDNTDETAIEFDFNGIIKMPKELEDTTSPCKIVDTQEEADAINEEWNKNSNPFTNTKISAITKKEAERRTKKYGPTERIFGDKEYGIIDWYEWAYHYWGTKWNAYEAHLLFQDDNTVVVEFQTAWATPEAIFNTLVERGFTVNCKWQDEDPSNEGEYGDPYSVFDIYHPQLEVSYMGRK